VIWLRLGCVAVAALNGLRWLRVAQREHYLPGRVSRFALRWRVIGLGLPFRGSRPGKLAWTRRLRTLAGVSLVLVIALAAVSWVGAVAAVIFTPVLVDVALVLTTPLENALANRWVKRAARKLAAVKPTVVAITGSYGKTSTKGYVAHLVAGSRSVVASPGSFNNRLGLARAINEHLAVGTEVFVAEMGTYGKGEIRALCRWLPPRIAAITAIGPVHLERFGSEERIVEAKSEIFERAEVKVLNGDDPRLAALAATLDGGVIVTHAADALVDLAPDSAAPTNVAVAVAIARELGVPDDAIAARLPTLPVPRHRLEVSTSPKGFTILDDTFNANPAGARRALDALGRQAPNGAGKRVLVTPGIYELGPRQREENTSFAAAASAVATDIVVVGRTNRAALLSGVGTGVEVRAAPTREKAVEWVRDSCGPGDVVLYVNDQPDHYP
jgi:UDP-N-acetylmuramoyl-tripeptide--D-alanyl-D-alanine ligase